MEIIKLKTKFVDNNNNLYHLCYSVFPEQGDNNFPAGYSILVEMSSTAGTETAVAHRISDLATVVSLAETLCKNTVTPVTLCDVVADYITQCSLY